MASTQLEKVLSAALRAVACAASSMSSGGLAGLWPTMSSIPAIQNGKPGFTVRSMTFARLPTGRVVPITLSGFGTTATSPGIGAIAFPGRGTTAGIGVPATISPSGYDR